MVCVVYNTRMRKMDSDGINHRLVSTHRRQGSDSQYIRYVYAHIHVESITEHLHIILLYSN